MSRFLRLAKIAYEGDDGFEDYEPKTYTLPKGTTLYHGTSSEEDFEIPDGPAWFSEGHGVADYFKDWNGGTNGRILEFETTQDLELVLFENKRDMEDFTGHYGIYDVSPREIAEAMCGLGFRGWIIPNNYPSGADILICSPEHVMENITGGRLSSGVKKPDNTQAIIENRPHWAQMSLRAADEQGVEVTPAGKIVLYHGTRSGEKIRKSGRLNAHTYLTPDPNIAKRYAMAAQQRGKPEVLRVEVPPEAVVPGSYWSTMEPLYLVGGSWEVR